MKTNKRYAANEGYTVSEVAAKVKSDIGNIDVVVGGVFLHYVTCIMILSSKKKCSLWCSHIDLTIL